MINTKPTLKCKTVTHLEVEYSDLDEFIGRTYARPFDSVGNEEWNNDSTHHFTVTKSKLSKVEKSDILEFQKTGEIPAGSLLTLLTDMCNHDLIPEGNYLVIVVW
jgi:hypothetical protein